MGKSPINTIKNLVSMTGFASMEEEFLLDDNTSCSLRMQAKSFNNRFLDIQLKLPGTYSFLELDLQKKVRSIMGRGRVEVQIFRDCSGSNFESVLNKNELENILAEIRSLSFDDINNREVVLSVIPALLQKREILDFTGVMKISDKEKELMLNMFVEVMEELSSSRKIEGKELSREVENQMNQISILVSKIDNISEDATKHLKEKLLARLKDLGTELAEDDSRIISEIAILADKVDIREEIVRIKAHIDHFYSVASEGGRKLDFIVQELLREFNTIGSKTSQAEVGSFVIESKAALERLREQLQNVE